MKRYIVILCAAVAVCLLGGCEKNEDQNIWTDLTVRLVWPEGYEAAAWEIERDSATSFITNQNTKELFEFPAFENDEATIRIPKGYYLVGLRISATLPNGQKQILDSTGHRSPDDPLYFMNDTETLTLELAVGVSQN